jgi:hypothetical protein
MANNGFQAISHMSFTAFCYSHGVPSTQKTKAGKTCMVFTDPKTDKDTYVSISEKLGITQENAEEFINDNFENLQVVQTEVPNDVMEEREARAEAGEDVQFESYVLCRKGEGTRKKLNLAFLQR